MQSVYNKQSISVIIPVYNSGQLLFDLYKRIDETLSGLTDNFEIIFVEDCGKDNSWSIITELAKSDNRVKGIHHTRNYGQHNAILRGIKAAKGDVIVTMDDDLQHPPEEIPKLLKKLEEGFDVVYGTPERKQHGLWRDTSSVLTKLVLQSLMGSATARKVGAFRAIRTKICKAFAHYQGTFVTIDVLLTWGTTSFGSIDVRHEPRNVGKSNYTFRKLVAHAINMMTGFSTMPLRFASMLGFFLTLLGIGLLIYVVGMYLITDTSVPGFPFLASIISIFSGAQLFSLGIMGEYLSGMHFRSMGRPYSVVGDMVGFNGESEGIK